MKTIFAPINRWKFLFYLFLLWIFTCLWLNFGMFFVTDTDITLPFSIFCFEIVILLFLIFKRLFDIYGKLWKSLVFTVFSVIFLIAVYFIGILASPMFNPNGTALGNRYILFLLPIYSLLLFLFLLLKNNKKTIFFNFEQKILSKRICLIVLIFGIYKFLCMSFNTLLPHADHRMYPTFELGDRLLVSRILPSAFLKREDIVCIKTDKNYLYPPLRIIGLPKEEIKLDGQKVFINGKLYSDKFAFYSKILKPINFQETIHLDENSYFLMGDNRYYDKRGQILGKDKIGKKVWRSINVKRNSKYDGIIYLTLKKDEIFGKVVVVHYDTFKFHNKFSKKQIMRINKNYAFSFQKFGFNPSSWSTDEFWGKP